MILLAPRPVRRGGVDLLEVVRAFLDLPEVRALPAIAQLRSVTIRDRPRAQHGGVFYASGDVSLCLGIADTSAAWRVLLAHEIAHAGHPFAVAHGRPWRRSFLELLGPVLGPGPGPGPGSTLAWPTDERGRALSYPAAHALWDRALRDTPEVGQPFYTVRHGSCTVP